MRDFAQTADAIAATRLKVKKIDILSEYLRNLNEDDLRAAAVFFTGRQFPLCWRARQAAAASAWRAAAGREGVAAWIDRCRRVWRPHLSD